MATTLLDPEFLSSISQLKTQGAQTQKFGAELLDALPIVAAQNNQIEGQKAAVRNIANEQTTALHRESTNVLQQTFEADQTPFYDVLAFFTDKPSFDELDNKQNQIASRMNTVSQVANTQLGQLAEEQLQLQRNLKLQQELFTTSRANVQAQAANIATRTAAVSEQEKFANAFIGR